MKKSGTKKTTRNKHGNLRQTIHVNVQSGTAADKRLERLTGGSSINVVKSRGRYNG